MTRKLNEYDLLKVVFILSVVIGHVTIRFNSSAYPQFDTRLCEAITKFVHLVNMPLFMSVSGAVFAIGLSHNKYRDFKGFVHNKFLRLIVPYLFVGCVFMVPLRLFLQDADVTWHDISRRFTELFLATDNRHLWFVLALFEIMVVHYTMVKLKVNDYAILALAFSLNLVWTWFFDVRYFNINMMVAKWPCFATGFVLVRHQNKWFFPISVVGSLLMPLGNYLTHNYYLDCVFTVAHPIFVIVVVFAVTRWIVSHVNLQHGWLTVLAEYNFSIYFFHVFCIDLLQHYWPVSESTLYLFVVTTILLSVIIPIPLSWLIRRLGGHALLGEKRPISR